MQLPRRTFLHLAASAAALPATSLIARAHAVPAQVSADLAPIGKLRVALFTLPIIAVRDAEGQFAGVVIDLSRELAKRLGVAVEFTTANSPPVAVDQVKNGQADLTFLVNLPERAAEIDFGATYIEYETSFLVLDNSPIRSLADVDGARRRIIVPAPSAVATTLSQKFKNVTIVGVPIATSSASKVVEMLRAGEADGYSNLTHLLSVTRRELPAWRIVPGSYMETVFSIGYRKSSPAGAAYVNHFIDEVKKSGFVKQAIERANLKGAVVPK
jgi:polar amino acid transport system substrate-binding protein